MARCVVEGYAVGVSRLRRFPRLGLVVACLPFVWIMLRQGAVAWGKPKGLVPRTLRVRRVIVRFTSVTTRRQWPRPAAPRRRDSSPGIFCTPPRGSTTRSPREAGRVWLNYEREDPTHALKGRQELRYFLGSGKRGRTYLFEQEGYWFEAPINWYAKKQIWDMTPNFLTAREMPLTLPVDPGCLHCHASGVAQSLPDARNHYAGEPFASGGITCASLPR